MLAVALCLLLQSAAPKLLSRVEPEYSQEARKAGLNGSVGIFAVVQADGHPTGRQVVRPLGLGLDEKAMAAVSQWRFQPGMRDGKAVDVKATVEVSFRLLPGRNFSPGWYTRRLTFQTPVGVTRPVVTGARFMAGSGQPEGSVTVSFLVDEEGKPSVPRVEKSSDSAL